MADLDAQVAALKARLSAAQRARVRAEHERDAAAAQADKARQQLEAEFGVSTVDDARTQLAAVEATLATALTELRAALDSIGA